MTIPKVPGKIKGLPAGRQGIAKIAVETGLLLGTLAIAFVIGRISGLQEARQDSDIQIIYPPLVNNQVAPYDKKP